MMPGRGRPESHTHTCTTHAGPTHAHGAWHNTHMWHTPHSAGTHGHTKGGRRDGAAGGGGGSSAGHTYMNAWLYTHLYTQGTAHSTASQRGGKVGRAANQGGHTAERKQKTVPVCAHTHQQGSTQHIRCVTALREERGVCGCGLWGTALLQCWGGPTTGTTEPRGWDGMGCVCETERDPMQERGGQANGPNIRNVEGSAPQ